jgi:hypothetical protein
MENHIKGVHTIPAASTKIKKKTSPKWGVWFFYSCRTWSDVCRVSAISLMTFVTVQVSDLRGNKS